jgi:NAD(P)-dependent dehydrogenase (short-subunit alcohol dehydrogenase family)
MKNILITGANRGLGLGFVKHYLSLGNRVWATYRNDSASLTDLKNAACIPVKWDVTEPLADSERAKLPDEINLLINNAGIYGAKNDGQDLHSIQPQDMLQVYNIDAVAPLMTVQSLLPLLKKGRATIANMSSKMGSVADNGSGGVYAYRAAKSALNIISRSLAVDLENDNIYVITLHPGWVQTDMTNQTGLINVETSVAGLCSVIDNAASYQPGAFIAFDGTEVPY